jgi:hypothetical protein
VLREVAEKSAVERHRESTTQRSAPEPSLGSTMPALVEPRALLVPLPSSRIIPPPAPVEAEARELEPAPQESAHGELFSGGTAAPPPPGGAGTQLQRSSLPELFAAIVATDRDDVGGLLVEDDTQAITSGQMRKSEFMRLLRTEVCRVAEEELQRAGRSAADCPYIEQMLSYYEGKSAEHVERAIRRYAPETRQVRDARDYLAPLGARLGHGIARWAETGQMPEDVPDETLAALAGARNGWIGAISAVIGLGPMRKATAASPGQVDATALSRQLGPGEPLEARTRARMEAALGYSFGAVRVHADERAATLSRDLAARAFTLGPHIAFGAGELRPGTPHGDALLAHELTHVVQQGAMLPSGEVAVSDAGDRLERDADEAAAAAVASLHASSSIVTEPKAGTRSSGAAGLQRACACGSGAAPGADGQCSSCRSKTLQRSPAPLDGLGEGRPLEGATRSRMEQGFGFDFGRVRIHDDPAGARAARDVGARAFTLGSDIGFAAGEFRPGTPAGDALLAHELAHTLQQTNGGVGGGVPVGRKPDAYAPQTDPAPERDADQAAIDVVSNLYARGAPRRRPSIQRSSGLALRRCNASLQPNPADQRESTHLPNATDQCELLSELGLMPDPAPAACSAPAPATSTSTPTSTAPAPAAPTVSAAARDAATAWDGAGTGAESDGKRAHLKTEFFAAVDDWLRENRTQNAELARSDSLRQPIATQQAPVDAAKMVVDRHFGAWAQGAVRTPFDAAHPYVPVAGRNLFDAGNPQTLTDHRVTSGLSAEARVLRIITQYSERARNAMRTHRFSPRRTSAEADFLLRVVSDYMTANPGNRTVLERVSRLRRAFHRSGEIWIQTYAARTREGRIQRRWESFQTAVHEYLHELCHPRFMAATDTSEHAFEGFTELFTREVLTPMFPNSVPSDVRSMVEGDDEDRSAPTQFNPYQTPEGYLESLRKAERIYARLQGPEISTGHCSSRPDQGGNNALKAAYFQGHVELIGLAPTGTRAGPVRASPDEVTVPEGVTTLDALSVASGLTVAEIRSANPSLGAGALPATLRLPGCREHIVTGYTSVNESRAETAVESRTQIAAMHGVAATALDRANPAVAARSWTEMTAGMSILIPRRR